MLTILGIVGLVYAAVLFVNTTGGTRNIKSLTTLGDSFFLFRGWAWSVSYFDYKDNKQRSSGGTWQFASDERQILRVTDNDAQLFNIMRLKEKELWFWYIDNCDKREYHLIPD